MHDYKTNKGLARDQSHALVVKPFVLAATAGPKAQASRAPDGPRKGPPARLNTDY